ncbi:MAG: DUF3795 domain-containing protein [Desulfobacterales bacterium]|nr:DUF3795 domain-containing protein [Desulfobacterales bacterium]
MEKIIAYCGLVCSECDVYIATINDDHNLRIELAKKYSNETHTAKPEDFYCEGCQNIQGEGCEIRQCATKENLENCAFCSEYYCDKVEKHFENSPESKEILEKIYQNRP